MTVQTTKRWRIGCVNWPPWPGHRIIQPSHNLSVESFLLSFIWAALIPLPSYSKHTFKIQGNHDGHAIPFVDIPKITLQYRYLMQKYGSLLDVNNIRYVVLCWTYKLCQRLPPLPLPIKFRGVRKILNQLGFWCCVLCLQPAPAKAQLLYQLIV